MLHRSIPLLVLSVVVACAPPPPMVTEFDARLAPLEQRWGDPHEHGVSGMAMVIVSGDEILATRTWGARDPERDLPVAVDTMFYVASCTKSFVAAAAGILADRGELDLQRPVAAYLPGFAREGLEGVSVEELLSHRPGWNNNVLTFLEAYSGDITPARFQVHLPQTDRGEPRYDNLHYTVLGRVLEAATGKTWQELVHELVLAPAGMRRTTTSAQSLYADANVAFPTTRRSGVDTICPVRKSDATMHAAGGMGASIRDVATWMQLQLNDGSLDDRAVVPAGVLRSGHAVATPNTDSPFPPFLGWTRDGFGQGWFVGEYAGHRIVHHDGSFFGSSAMVSFMPDENIGVAILSNSESVFPIVMLTDVYNLWLDVDRPDPWDPVVGYQAMRAQQAREAHEAFPSPLGEDSLTLPLAAYSGPYHNPDWGTIRVVETGRALRAQLGALPLRLARGSSTDAATVELGMSDQTEATFRLAEDRVQALEIELEGRRVAFTRR